MQVKNELDYLEREKMWNTKDKDLIRKNEERKRNKNFTQLYEEGSLMLEFIIADNPQAAKLYLYLSRHMDPVFGTVIVSQHLLAKYFSCSVRTIRRYCQYLFRCHAMTRITIQDNLSVYCLNSDMVWRSWDSNKQYAAFQLAETDTITLQAAVIIDKEKNVNIMGRVLAMIKTNKEFLAIQNDKTRTEFEKYLLKKEYVDNLSNNQDNTLDTLED